MKKILFTLLSLSSLSAHAGEFWFRTAGKLFRARVPQEVTNEQLLQPEELIELLQGAQIEEVKVHQAGAKLWTEPGLQRTAPWTEPGLQRTAPWTEPSIQRSATWTEPGVQRPVLWTEPGLQRPSPEASEGSEQ